MQDSKFTFNAFLLVVVIFSAIAFFFTVKLVAVAERFPVNEFFPIEGTDLAIRYSSLDPSGIYQGSENAGVLMLEGSFGYDWGAALEGGCLYANEYTTTDLGLMLSDVVRVDLDTFEKEVLLHDAILRGTCVSGELVCLGGVMMPASQPKTNPLCTLYSMTAGDIHPEGDSAIVMFLDPGTGEILYSVRDDEALTDAFEARYLERTLEEVRQ